MSDYLVDRRVLLLDASLQPVDIISGRKAIEHLYEGKAQVLEEYEQYPIRSQKLTLHLPAVMQLFPNGSNKRRFVKFSRPNVFWRDGYRCMYCGQKKPKDKLTLDHVIPKKTRTKDSYKSWVNIVTACGPCNQKKADRTPEQAGMRLLKQPYKPVWEPAMTITVLPSDPACWKPYLEKYL